MNLVNSTDINRFVEAQNQQWGSYNTALIEIRNGHKTSHWIWYIFPQLRGLGHSSMSHFYGIADRNEAEAYLNHPLLGSRLREITEVLLTHSSMTAIEIFGGIDALKVKSCMTLFDSISPDDIFGQVLDCFYGGQRDRHSIV